MRKAVLIAVVAGLVIAGGATAQSLITSGDIRNNTIKSKDIKNRAIKKKDLSRRTVSQLQGATGPQGPQGPQGEPGPAGGGGAGSTLHVLMQSTGDTPIADLLSVNGWRLQGGCQASQPVLRSQTLVDNSIVKGLGDGATANKRYSEDDNFDVGDTVTHTDANTQSNSIFNLTFATLAGDVATAVLGVESTPVGFDCEIFGTATSATAP
jgi:hypothetical protein